MERMTQLVSLKGWHDGEPVAAWRCECPDDHAYVVENDMCGDVNRYILGPIVDRLYEYEQLGMTPEEITEKLREQTAKIVKYRIEELGVQTLVTTVDEQAKQIGDLKNEIAEREKVEMTLRKEIKRLEQVVRDYVDTLEVILETALMAI